MKICQIVPSLEARHGGPSRSVRSLALSLARLGHDVDLLTTRPEAGVDETTDGTLRVIQFHRDFPAGLCASGDLRAHLRSTAYDCVHHHALWLRTLHYARRAARGTGTPLVISPRGMLAGWSWRHHRWRKRIAESLIHPGALGWAAGWHATSAAEADEIRARGWNQPICIAPNGVAAPDADDAARAHEAWSGLCPAAASRPVALFYSRFHRKKRLLELIDLWLATAPRNWLLLVVGIPQEYTVERLAAYVERHGAADRVAVFDGTGRPPPYGIASLFLLPSHTENFGLAIAEAMAWGVPAVVTDTTPWTGVSEEEAGWCVPWEAYPDALREALAESSERREQRGARARDWVLSRYSWECAAESLVAFYAKLRDRAA